MSNAWKDFKKWFNGREGEAWDEQRRKNVEELKEKLDVLNKQTVALKAKHDALCVRLQRMNEYINKQTIL